jgi:hypothetical protein
MNSDRSRETIPFQVIITNFKLAPFLKASCPILEKIIYLIIITMFVFFFSCLIFSTGICRIKYFDKLSATTHQTSTKKFAHMVGK